MPEWISTWAGMQSAVGSNPSVFVSYSLPFQIKKFGLRYPGYPQMPKRFFTKKTGAP